MSARQNSKYVERISTGALSAPESDNEDFTPAKRPAGSLLLPFLPCQSSASQHVRLEWGLLRVI